MGIKKRKSKKGFTVIEAIISLVLFTLIMIPLGSFTLTAVKTSVKSSEKQQAIDIAQSTIEQIKALKIDKLYNLSTYPDKNKIVLSNGIIVTLNKENNSQNSFDSYKVNGIFKTNNTNKEFEVEGTIIPNLNGYNQNKDESKDSTELDFNYCVYIGNTSITVYRIVNREWYRLKYKRINNQSNDLLELSIDKNSNGTVDIKSTHEGENIVVNNDNVRTGNDINKLDLLDKSKNSKVKVLFYEDEKNKAIKLKASNNDVEGDLSVYAYKYKGSGVRYYDNIENTNPQGIVKIYKNYVEKSPYDNKVGLYDIDLNVNYGNEEIYSIKATEFIGE
ncbi:prepilin-type N-terminal cleavage/methylation domain-containing protein [Clostridium perfringens]|nr:prepilin-type N-terminal cleavage/methylation domain-containing protein [Clostridium perfringens]MDK0711994.1 prepilin-type N-terminal cleavage/methylation domain-containing protein [Clostridium perfringens]